MHLYKWMVALVFAGALQCAAQSVPSQLYGCWRVTRDLPAGAIGGLSADEIAKFRNTQVCFEEKRIVSKTGKEVVLGAETSELSQEQWWYTVLATPKRLGIPEGAVTLVVIKVAAQDHSVFGENVYLTGASVIIGYENTFFELRKLHQSTPRHHLQ